MRVKSGRCHSSIPPCILPLLFSIVVAAIMLIPPVQQAAPYYAAASPIDGASVDKGVRSGRGDTWTFMVYMDGDNDLEGMAVDDFNEMENVGSNENLNIVVQFDRTPGHDNSNGDWTGTRRYYVLKDDTYDASSTNPDRTIRSQMLEDLGEVNMASESSFEDFLYWAMGNYTADHYVLMLWDHGSGIFRGPGSGTRGVALDSTDGGELELWEIDNAMERVEAFYSARINITGFDVCFLGDWETVYELADVTDYVIASADEEPDKGWDYTPALQEIVNNPAISPEEFSKRAVEHYLAQYTSVSFVTQTAVDVAAFMDYFVPALNDFSLRLSNYMYPYRLIIRDIRNSTDYFYGENVDLGDFANRIAARNDLPADLIESAENMVQAIDSCVIYKGSGVEHRNYFTGMAIYFPRYYYNTAYTTYLDISAEKWDDFLDIFLHPELMGVSIEHTPLRDTEDADSPRLVSAKITGKTLDRSSPQLHYSFGEGFTAVAMSGVDSTYTAAIPAAGKETDVYYYISARDELGNITTYPAGANESIPSSMCSYHVGPDTVPPVITHIPLEDTMDTVNPYEVEATVSDNIGVDSDSVYLHWRVVYNAGDVNGSGRNGSNITYNTEKMDPITVDEYGDGTYSALIPAEPMGTRVYYYITANDSASSPNSARSPPAGEHTFLVESPYGSIMVDYAHNNILEGYNSSEYFLDLDKYVVDFLLRPIDSDVLADYDIFISLRPSMPFTDEELSALVSFIEEGGSFILVPGSDLNVVSDILARLNYTVSWDGYTGSEQIPITQSTVLTHDLDYIYVNYQRNGRYTVVPPANATKHLESTAGVVCASSVYGKGMGRFLFLHDGIIDYPYVTLYTYNRPFASRIIPWLLSNQAPTALIDANRTSVKPGESVRLTSQSSDSDGYITNTTWMLDNGTYLYGESITLSFSQAGERNITLIVKDNDGDVATTYIIIRVLTAPVAVIHAPSVNDGQVKTYESVLFESASYDSDGTITAWHWDFGDGIQSDEEATEHVWTTPGMYTVTLTVTDNTGLTGSTSMVVMVKNRLPTADFTMNVSLSRDPNDTLYMPEMDRNGIYHIMEDQLIILNASPSHDLDSTIVNYTWDWGDGTQSFGIMGEHYYTTYDIYEVSLIVIDSYGDQSVKSIKFSVTNPAPEVDIKWDIVGLDIRLYTTKLTDTESDRDNLTLVWDMGDGHTVYNKTDFHYRYASEGEYIINLTVYDDEGAYNRTTLKVLLRPSPIERVFGEYTPYVQAVLVLIVIALFASWLYEIYNVKKGNGKNSEADEKSPEDGKAVEESHPEEDMGRGEPRLERGEGSKKKKVKE